jgi:cobaltochelatase CobS
MSADAESSVLFGQLVVREGATVWEDGPITEAVRHGGVVLIDEWELMPPEISMGLQNLLEDDGYLFLKEKPGSAEDKTFIPHKNFRLICAGNTVGQGDETGGFSGTMVQNSATLDRFTTTVCLDYLSKMHEVSIIRNKTAVKKPIAEGMVKLASLIRNAYNQRQVNLTMSPRTLISWGNKIVRHNGNLWFAFSIAYYDKLRDSDKKVVKELFEKVFAEEKA